MLARDGVPLNVSTTDGRTPVDLAAVFGRRVALDTLALVLPMQSAMFTEPPTQDAFSATLFTMMREQVAVKGREAVAAALGRHWGKYCAPRGQDHGRGPRPLSMDLARAGPGEVRVHGLQSDPRRQARARASP